MKIHLLAVLTVLCVIFVGPSPILVGRSPIARPEL